ncbi:MAG: EAL domain-containing response regulator [Candidatus Endonucleobacter bathymodioli]|uniref:EAL domain-containing response regulator n=1 Tax=Candidatus Endonucleibacter bathymodioli TaxID=539814 RepID=A0AA90NV37_9GAMM|nr:EAL domain-containing response regulator [Candidatus Endonucleobacter bathymodioli]
MSTDVKTLRVLVVEDHKFQQKIIVQALRIIGIEQIEVAENGLEALNILRAKAPINIVLCDLDLPKMDGILLIQKMKTKAPEAAIIISSAKDSSLIRAVEDIAKNHNLNLLGSLPKPVSIELLDELINNYWNQIVQKEYEHLDVPITAAMLERAMNENQFELYFQPKVELKTGRLKSAEGLARWNHPELGTISPRAFIPMLESSRLIDRFTMLLMDQALDQVHAWKDQGRSISVAINISPLMLDNSQLADHILKKTVSRNISPSLLTLEITETGLIENMDAALVSLVRLKMFGFSLSIDDFGIGYSSMEQLSRIPFSELKIDRSFVHNASQNKKLKAIVEANIFLARNLNLKTVAEGIETLEDWWLLSDMKCDFAQGYFIASPMPASELNTWEARWKSKNPSIDETE